jgi:large subunit ribosomal protein L18
VYKRKRSIYIKKRRKEKIMKLNTSQRKKYRIRNKLKKSASEDRYRLSIDRSSKNISAQIIDDINNKTLVSSTSNEKKIKDLKKNKSDLSVLVAENLAKKAQEKKISKIYFDRGSYKYHGRIKVFAEALRKNGMEF